MFLFSLVSKSMLISLLISSMNCHLVNSILLSLGESVKVSFFYCLILCMKVILYRLSSMHLCT